MTRTRTIAKLTSDAQDPRRRHTQRCPFCDSVMMAYLEHKCSAVYLADSEGLITGVQLYPVAQLRTMRPRPPHKPYSFTFIRTCLPAARQWRRCRPVHVQKRKERRRCVLCSHTRESHLGGRCLPATMTQFSPTGYGFVQEVRCRELTPNGKRCTCLRFREEDADLAPNVPRHHYLPPEQQDD